MKVSDLTLGILCKHLHRVRTRLSKSSTGGALLAAARTDTPIIEEITGQFVSVFQNRSMRGRKSALQVLERDLLILLALREIEREQREKGQACLWAARIER